MQSIQLVGPTLPAPQFSTAPTPSALELRITDELIDCAVRRRAASRRVTTTPCYRCGYPLTDPGLPCPGCEVGAVEFRSAAATVDRDQRIITIIAAPYEAPAQVEYRGRVWTEVFSRSAFNGIEQRANKIRVNRDHDRGRTIGKVVKFNPRHRQGLLAEIRVARTALGDESLALASEDCLSASVGFGVPVGGEQLDHRARTRRINRAVLDHIALVESPAYTGAAVLAVG